MPKQTPQLELLRWSDHVPTSDVQDPLGLALRGSARLANLLLFCVTSITPRARYFAFIPWSIANWRDHERGLRHAVGLREALVLREKALALGCIAHHDGRSCDGGALVGSDNVTTWYARGQSDVDLRRLPFAKNPAFDAYFNSLVNLGAFVADEQYPAIGEDEVQARSFDDLELSPLGERLAESYGKSLGQLGVLRDITSAKRRCSLSGLRELGRRGGLCELAGRRSPDRRLLRDVFFERVALPGAAHLHRKQSLLLIIEISRQLSARGRTLTETTFGAASYYGEMLSDGGDAEAINIPDPLRDISTRWRMFYFHHYMSVALEGMFAWLVAQAAAAGLAGVRLGELAGQLSSKAAGAALAELFGQELGELVGRSTPADLLHRFADASGPLDAATSGLVDLRLRANRSLSELRLEPLIRSGTYLASPAGLAIPLLLLGLTLSRYVQWEDTKYGHWLAGTASDPYLDLVPPVVTAGLARMFGSWWDSSWEALALFILSRYVVQQHQSMSYEKSSSGDRCLLQVDGDRVAARPTDAYEKLGMGNPRFRSAASILFDLGLLEMNGDGLTHPSIEGTALLRDELDALEQA